MSRRRRTGTVLVVVMVMLTAVAGPASAQVPSGDTQPSLSQDTCNAAVGYASALAGILGLTGAVAGAGGTYCASQTTQDMQAGSTNATKYNIRQAAAETASNAETYLATANNSLQNLRTTLFAYGQSEQVAEIRNGSSASQTNVAVNASIDDRVTKMQINRINAWNQYAQSISNLASLQTNTSVGVLKFYKNSTSSSGDTKSSTKVATGDNVILENTSVTLANGSTKAMARLNAQLSNTNLYTSLTTNIGGTTYYQYSRVLQFFWTTDSGTKRFLISTGGTDKTAFGRDYRVNWQTLKQKAQLVKTNLAATSDDMVAAYQAGELNLSDAVSSLTYAQEYTTKYGETGNLAYARAAAASAGYAVPDLDNVSVMTVRDADTGYNYTGALFSQYAPTNGTWEVGPTYNASEIQGIQVVATTSGSMHELSGEFAITSMKGANGQDVVSAEVRDYTYETSNVSEYQQLQEDINDLRNQIANQTATGGGGGSSGGSGNPALVLGVFGVLALGIAVVLSREG